MTKQPMIDENEDGTIVFTWKVGEIIFSIALDPVALHESTWIMIENGRIHGDYNGDRFVETLRKIV